MGRTGQSTPQLSSLRPATNFKPHLVKGTTPIAPFVTSLLSLQHPLSALLQSPLRLLMPRVSTLLSLTCTRNGSNSSTPDRRIFSYRETLRYSSRDSHSRFMTCHRRSSSLRKWDLDKTLPKRYRKSLKMIQTSSQLIYR